MTQTTAPFGLVVRFTLKPGSEQPFDTLTAETVAEISRHEPGTLVYACHRDIDTETPARVFYELYADRAAFDAHESQPHVRRFLQEREQHLQRTDVTFLHLDTAAGLATALGIDRG